MLFAGAEIGQRALARVFGGFAQGLGESGHCFIRGEMSTSVADLLDLLWCIDWLLFAPGCGCRRMVDNCSVVRAKVADHGVQIGCRGFDVSRWRGYFADNGLVRLGVGIRIDHRLRILADDLRGVLDLLGQFARTSSATGKTAACFAGAGGFDGGIEGQQVGLVGNVVAQNDLVDLHRAGMQFGDGRAKCSMCWLVDRIVSRRFPSAPASAGRDRGCSG